MKRYLMAAVLLAGAGAILLKWESIIQAPALPSLSLPATSSQAVATTQTATLVVFDGTKDIFENDLPITATTTVFSLLQYASTNPTLTLEYRSYPGMGTLITRIGAATNGAGGKYWQFWVNGVYAQKSADNVLVHAGDRVEWRFGAQ